MALPLLALGSLPTQAQEPPTFGAGVELVQIEVRATDEDGRPVADLRPEDFLLEEEGEPQEIEAFQLVGGPAAETVHVVASEPPSKRPASAGPRRRARSC